MHIIEARPIYHHDAKTVPSPKTGKPVKRSIRIFLGIKIVFDDVDRRLMGQPCCDGHGKRVEPSGTTVFWSPKHDTYSVTEPHRPELDESTAPWCRIARRFKMEEAQPARMDGSIVVKAKRVKNNPDSKIKSWSVRDFTKNCPGLAAMALPAIAAAEQERLTEAVGEAA